MDRRQAIKSILQQGAGALSLSMSPCCSPFSSHSLNRLFNEFEGPEIAKTPQKDTSAEKKTLPQLQEKSDLEATQIDDLAFKNINIKTEEFDLNHPGDIFLEQKKIKVMLNIHKKITAFNNYVGYAHFNLTSFDQLIKFSKSCSKLESFTKIEKDFFEEIFYTPAELYGFFGSKLQKNLTTRIENRDVIKIPRSGHYLYKENSLPIYQKIQKDVGSSIILTSGIRNTVKQFHLFFGKAINSKFNLSLASRSIAPPGYSYHSVGDFDVGKKGMGYRNFTSKFSQTDEYKKLIDLGYIDIRYHTNNPFGVRFEPWHMKSKYNLV